MSKNEKNLIVGLDIGTTKVIALVGEVSPEGEIELIGVGSHASRGLKRGVVVNIESTVKSIQSALEEAELMAGCQIHSAFTGIAGNHVHSLNSHGIVAIRDLEVTEQDVERVIDAAKAVAVSADQQIIHVLPQEFIIDNQGGIKEPVGMSGVRLEAKVHMITGSVSAAQNITKSVERCGIEVADVILEQLASSHAVLNEDEKELGICLVDIGGGTTDIAVFHDGAIQHTAVIPIAGDQVTNDVAVALRTPTQAAEALKIEHGRLHTRMVAPNEMIDVTGVNNRPGDSIPTRMLTEVIEARYEELFHLVLAELKRSGFADMVAAGMVLTGGASLLPGVTQLAESIFRMPVRVGLPQGIIGSDEIMSNPKYATGVGLLLHGRYQQQGHLHEPLMRDGVKSIWGRMRHWFQGNF